MLSRSDRTLRGCIRRGHFWPQLQIADIDHVLRAQRRGALQNIFELAHITWERVLAQRLESDRRDRQGLDLELLRKLEQERVDELWNVVQSIAQRRHANLNDIDSIEKVLTKFSFAHELR